MSAILFGCATTQSQVSRGYAFGAMSIAVLCKAGLEESATRPINITAEQIVKTYGGSGWDLKLRSSGLVGWLVGGVHSWPKCVKPPHTHTVGTILCRKHSGGHLV